jgi:uncharacterized membrane protein (UPF0127 family)
MKLPLTSHDSSTIHHTMQTIRSICSTHRIKKWTLSLSVLVCCQAQSGWAESAPQMNLPRTQIKAGMYLVDAQVAAQPEQRAVGLMHRSNLPSHEGMLFVFEQTAPQCFWMKNTLIPLTAAFIADDGTIVNTADMQPQTTVSHCSAQPVRYVLEMNQGWFSRRGIKVGDRLGHPTLFTKP